MNDKPTPTRISIQFESPPDYPAPMVSMDPEVSDTLDFDVHEYETTEQAGIAAIERVWSEVEAAQDNAGTERETLILGVETYLDIMAVLDHHDGPSFDSWVPAEDYHVVPGRMVHAPLDPKVAAWSHISGDDA